MIGNTGDVTLLEDGRFRQVSVQSLGDNALGPLTSALGENERLLLVVHDRSWLLDDWWAITDTLCLVHLLSDPVRRYELARVSALGLKAQGKVLSFFYGDERVSVPHGSSLLGWLREQGIKPLYESVDLVTESFGIYAKPWEDFPEDVRNFVEKSLRSGDRLVFCAEINNTLSWVCTDTYLVQVKSQSERFQLDGISRLWWSPGWVDSLLRFSYGGRTIRAENGKAVFWALFERWPYLCQETMVQPDEIAVATPSQLRQVDFLCLIGEETSVHELLNYRQTNLRYVRTSGSILAKRAGSIKDYLQVVDCPICGGRVLFRVNKGRPQIISSRQKARWFAREYHILK